MNTITLEGTITEASKDKIRIISDDPHQKPMEIACDGMFIYCQEKEAKISIQIGGYTDLDRRRTMLTFTLNL